MLGPKQRVHLAVVDVLSPQCHVQFKQMAQSPDVFLFEPTVGHLAQEPLEFMLMFWSFGHVESVRPSF
jgi:hypothetical protein